MRSTGMSPKIVSVIGMTEKHGCGGRWQKNRRDQCWRCGVRHLSHVGCK